MRQAISLSLLTLLSLAFAGDLNAADHVVGQQTPPPFKVPAKKKGQYYLQFFAVGDVGTGGEGQKQIAIRMSNRAKKQPISLVLLLGDNFYGTGVSSAHDPQWESKFHKMYAQKPLAVPFYATLGNHDHYGTPNAQVKHAKCCSKDRWRMPARYYTFQRQLGLDATVQFFALDTYPIHATRAERLHQLTWLEKELATSTATWKIVFGHHPLYSNGRHGNGDEMIAALAPMFKKHKVDLFLAGHDHDQQMLRPVDGVNYIISGAGAKSRSVSWEKNTIYAATNLGFTAFRLSEEELVVEFINVEGRVEYAHVMQKPRAKASKQAPK